MLKKIKSTGRSSINKMIEKDIDEAFFKLGFKYKKNPSYTTMHNFGVLLSKYGNEISFFSKDNAEFAKKLLMLANKQKESFITLKELGDLSFGQKEYESAVSFYSSALNYKETYSVCNNIIQCYYFLGNYKKMKICSEKFIKQQKFKDFELVNLQELYGFACALSNDKPMAINVLKQLQRNPLYSMTPETLKLAYLCEDYLFIIQNYQKVFNEWIIEAIDYKIIHHAFLKSQIEKLDEFKKWVDEKVVGFYKENPNFEPDEELINAIRSGSNDYCLKIKLSITPVYSCDFYKSSIKGRLA